VRKERSARHEANERALWRRRGANRWAKARYPGAVKCFASAARGDAAWEGRRWVASSNCAKARSAAERRLSPAALRSALGARLLDGHLKGLGQVLFHHLRLASGAQRASAALLSVKRPDMTRRRTGLRRVRASMTAMCSCSGYSCPARTHAKSRVWPWRRAGASAGKPSLARGWLVGAPAARLRAPRGPAQPPARRCRPPGARTGGRRDAPWRRRAQRT
jgi:hypothetical protein